MLPQHNSSGGQLQKHKMFARSNCPSSAGAANRPAVGHGAACIAPCAMARPSVALLSKVDQGNRPGQGSAAACVWSFLEDGRKCKKLGKKMAKKIRLLRAGKLVYQ